MRCRTFSVVAVVGWSREASEPRHPDSIECDAWEAAVPQLPFDPPDASRQATPGGDRPA